MAEYRKVLKSSKREEEVQQFLAKNPALLAPDVVRVHPKVKLGAEYVTDFVLEYPEGGYRPRYLLVEIEKPGQKPFTKKDAQSNRLTHALTRSVTGRSGSDEISAMPSRVFLE